MNIIATASSPPPLPAHAITLTCRSNRLMVLSICGAGYCLSYPAMEWKHTPAIRNGFRNRIASENLASDTGVRPLMK